MTDEDGTATEREPMPEFSALAAFAEWCRANCGRPGASHDGRLCGETTTTPEGEHYTTFCGHHLGAVLGDD